MLSRPISKQWDVRKDARNYGIIGDGATANATALNSAITTLSSAGGATLEFPAGTYLIDSTVTLKKNVMLYLHPGATLKWSGVAGGTMFTSPSDRVLVYAGMCGGGRIDYQNASIVFHLHSHQTCKWEDLYFISYDASTVYSVDSILFKLVADSSSATDAVFVPLTNIVSNYYGNLYQGGIIDWKYATGKFFEFSGGTNAPITLNTFGNLMAHMISRKGLDFVQWTDNNIFMGIIRLNVYGNNSAGVEINSGTPTTEGQVYLNNFHHLAVDTFSHPTIPGFESFTGRVGLKINYSQHTKVDNYYNQMTDAGGFSIKDNGYSFSHYVVFHDYPGTNRDIKLISKNLTNFGGASLTVQETDGVPSVSGVNTIKFTNGTVTDNGGGVVTVAIGNNADGGLIGEPDTSGKTVDGGSL